MYPPMLLHLHVATLGKPRFGLWLPLFLVWLILLPLMVLVLAVTVLVDVVLFLAGQDYHHYTLLLFGCFEVLGATRGTVWHVYADTTVVEIELV